MTTSCGSSHQTTTWELKTNHTHAHFHGMLLHSFTRVLFIFGGGRKKKNRHIFKCMHVRIREQNHLYSCHGNKKNPTCSQTRTQKEAQRQIKPSTESMSKYECYYFVMQLQRHNSSPYNFIFLFLFWKRSSPIGPTFVLFLFLPTPCHLFSSCFCPKPKKNKRCRNCMM